MDSNIVRTRVKKSTPGIVHSKQKNFSIVVITYTNRFKFSCIESSWDLSHLKNNRKYQKFSFCTKSKNLSNLLKSLKKCTLF